MAWPVTHTCVCSVSLTLTVGPAHTHHTYAQQSMAWPELWSASNLTFTVGPAALFVLFSWSGSSMTSQRTPLDSACSYWSLKEGEAWGNSSARIPDSHKALSTCEGMTTRQERGQV